MSGVSIGYFTPDDVVMDVDFFCRRLAHRMGPAKASWPLLVRTIDGHPLAYAKVDGHIALHIDTEEAQRQQSEMFHFVFRAENRPVLLTGKAMDGGVEPQDEHEIMAIHRTKALLTGHDPRSLNTFTIGCTELVAGMVVHFDIATHWHGVTAAPVPARNIGIRQDPKLILVQMMGYPSTDIGRAVTDMTSLLLADMAYWNHPRRDKGD